MHPDTAHRGRRLYVALGFLGLDVPPAAMPPELRALHAWLDSWHGIGLIEHGLARQARDLSLTRYGDRWGGDGVRDGSRALDRAGLRVADDAVGRGATGCVSGAAPGRILEQRSAGPVKLGGISRRWLAWSSGFALLPDSCGTHKFSTEADMELVRFDGEDPVL